MTSIITGNIINF